MIEFKMHRQPDGETCGPTSLYAVYRHYGLECSLEEVIASVERTSSGGSLAAFLGKDALLRGFEAIIYVNNLVVFDPSWFKKGRCDRDFLIQKLKLQLKVKHEADLVQASQAYIHFLSLGGEVRFETLNKQLLKKYLHQKIPILTGLSATYLYDHARYLYQGSEVFLNDIEGTPCGHFVVLCGYDESHRHVLVADPSEENPLSHDHYYAVKMDRLINSILLGVLTYDANLLILQPRDKKENHADHSRCGLEYHFR